MTTHLESQDGETQSGGGMVDAEVQVEIELECQSTYRFESCPDYKNKLKLCL